MNLFSPTLLPYTAAVLHGTVALVWTALANSYCRCHGTARPQGALLRLFRLMAWLFAAHYFSKMLLDLVPNADAEPLLYSFGCLVTEIPGTFVLPVLRHLIPLGTLGSPKPSRRWLAVNYGLALVALLSLHFRDVLPINVWSLYFAGFSTLVLWDLVVLARAKRRPVLMADLRFGGYLVFSVALFAAVLILVFTERWDTSEQSPVWILSHSFLGLAAALPFAVRVFGEVLRSLLLNGLRIAVVAFLYGTLHSLSQATARPETAWAIDLLAVLALVYLLGSGSQRLADWIDLLILRRGRPWRHRLKAAVYELRPETGVHATCAAATASVAEILRMPGAAILLDDQPQAIVHGNFAIQPVVDAWPRGDAARNLPHGTFDLLWLSDLKLQQAMLNAQATWVVPIVSPRRQWGRLFLSAGKLGNSIDHGQLYVLEDFAREVALVLDAAHLLSRVREAERDLADHEKLAALGETAARIAHEIRNPVTAARSLSQLIAEEPISPLNEKHAALVVRELDRVEHQVRALLQFAHRETYSFDNLDLATSIETTVADLRSTRVMSDVDVRVELTRDLRVLADGERLRQVWVNLIGNALDAVKSTGRPGFVHISCDQRDSVAEIQIRDSGPGVEDSLLSRLFEPFVSAKAQGTGLGLAISKRIVEAHGGEISARAGESEGLVFRISLPLHGPGSQDKQPAAASPSTSIPRSPSRPTSLSKPMETPLDLR